MDARERRGREVVDAISRGHGVERQRLGVTGTPTREREAAHDVTDNTSLTILV